MGVGVTTDHTGQSGVRFISWGKGHRKYYREKQNPHPGKHSCPWPQALCTGYWGLSRTLHPHWPGAIHSPSRMPFCMAHATSRQGTLESRCSVCPARPCLAALLVLLSGQPMSLSQSFARLALRCQAHVCCILKLVSTAAGPQCVYSG